MRTNKNFTVIISVISLVVSISTLIFGIYQYNKQRKETAFPYLE